MTVAVKYGVVYPDGTYTSGITEHYRLAKHYAREHEGAVYAVGGPDDPEVKA